MLNRKLSFRFALTLVALIAISTITATANWGTNWNVLEFLGITETTSPISETTPESTTAPEPAPFLIGVTVTGTAVTSPALAGSYPDLASALTALNAVTSYPSPGTIIFTVSGSETAPVKGFVVGSATLNPLLSATNTITITGPATINAGVGTSASPAASSDGMLYLNGADFVTIDGLTFTDGNSASATVAMEFGVALFKRAAGDGSNNNTIQNCIFNMQRISNGNGTTPMLDGSWAIEVVNSTPAAATTSLTPTNGGTLATNGTNSNNKFYTNTINGGNGGIGINGFAASTGVGPSPTATTFLGDLNNDIGGAALANGNTILNFGGGAAVSPAAGIRANNQWSVNLSYNTVNNNNGTGVNHATTLRGIYPQAGTSASATINNNIVSVQSGATTSAATAIDNGIGSTAASNTVSISNNIVSIAYTTSTTGVMTGINNSASAATVNMNGNTVQGIPGSPLAGTVTHVMMEAGSPTTVTTNNNIIQNLQRNGASGSWRGIKATSPTNWTANLNTVNNLSWTLVTSTGSTDGIFGLSSSVNVTVTNNTISNLSTPSTGTISGIREWGSSGTKLIQNNSINNFSTTAGGAGGAGFNGIYCSIGNIEVSGNIINSLNSTGTTGGTSATVYGVQISGGTTNNVFRNKIYDLSSNSTGPIVAGITVSSGTTNTIYNNLVGDLRTPAANLANPLIGLNITGGTTGNVYFNTVYLNGASTGALFGSSAVSVSTSPTVTLRNNIFVNNSSTMGPGLAVAYRRSSTTLTSYASASNNNDFFASTIYTDGTNTDAGIAAYKARVSSRDSASISEDPEFQSTAGANANFLKFRVTAPKFIESGASNVAGITDDFAGTIRAGNGGYAGTGSNPDVGAWELEGMSAGDFAGPSITYTNFANTTSTANRTLTATITDATGVNLTPGSEPRIYFRKGTSGAYTPAACSGPITGNALNGTYDCVIDHSAITAAGGDTVQYYVAAQDTLLNVSTSPGGGSGTTPPGTTAPGSPNSYVILLVVSAYPYSQDFNTNEGGYTAGNTIGAVSDWQFGTFAKTQLTGPRGGSGNAWVTKLVGTYSTSTTSTLTSPIFDFSSLSLRPTLSFWHNFKSEAAWDVASLEYSINGGTVWTKVDATLGTGAGVFNTTDSTAWYNSNTASGVAQHGIAAPVWNVTSTAYTAASAGWVKSTTLLPAAVLTQPDVRFRWRFGSDNSTNDEGWAIDDVSVSVDDVTPPVITYTALGNTTSFANRTQTISVTDNVGVGTGGGLPVLYFRKGTVGAYTAGACAPAVLPNYDCTIDHSAVGGVIAGDTIQYYVAAQDTAATPNVSVNPSAGASGFTATPPAVSTPPTSPSSYLIAIGYSGSVNVGTGEAITSLTNSGGLFSLLNVGVLTGHTTINLTSDLIAETGTVSLTQLAEEGVGGYTLTILPSATPRIVSGSSSSCLINLNGADRVVFDGAVTGTAKDTTYSNTNSNGATVCFANAATNNTFKNSIIRGVSTSNFNGVVFFSTVASGTTGNSNNTIQNNDISGGASAPNYTVFNSGTSSAKNANNTITQNRIFNFSSTGIRDDGNSAGATYSNNEIFEVTTQTTSLVGFRPSSTSIDGFTFTRNNIHDLNTTSNVSVFGIHLFDTSTLQVSTVSNNFISLGATTPLSLRGIYDQTAVGEHYNIYFNTVQLYGTVTGISNSEVYYWSIASTSNVRNNIFKSSRVGGTGKHYVYRTNTPLANLISDYNDIYAVGAIFGNNGTADVANLTDWKSASPTGTGKDANSIALDPEFRSATDLHIKRTDPAVASPVEDAGVTIAGVATDYDGDTRHLTTPDIGADEVKGINLSAATYSSGSEGNMLVQATITVNRAADTGSAASIAYATTDGTATGGAACTTPGVEDYITAAGTLNFAANELSKTFTVDVCPDTIYEGDETINITLSDAGGGSTLVTPGAAVLTITEDEVIPTVSVNDHLFAAQSVAAGGGFTVTLSGPSGTTVLVPYSSGGGSATGGAGPGCSTGDDYISVSGTLSFAPGDVSEEIPVTICTDTVQEPTETFNLTLGTPTGATILDGVGVGTISSEDLATASVGTPAAQLEGNSPATSTMTFPVTLATTNSVNTVINYTINDGTATAADNDFDDGGSGSITILAGNNTGNIAVTINGDDTLEADETFTVTITSPDVAIGTGTATGTILNDDCVTPPSGMVSWYPGETDADDIGGTNEGTEVNGVTHVGGKVGQAFDFNRLSQQYVTIPNSASFQSPNLSVDGWFQIDNTVDLQVLVTKKFGGGVLQTFAIFYQNGVLGAIDHNVIVSAPFTPAPGVWYHIAYTLDDDTNQQKVYLNGALFASGASAGSTLIDTNPVMIGGEDEGGVLSYFFDGRADEIEIFNRVLGAGEIADLAKASGAGKCHTSTLQLSAATGTVAEAGMATFTVTRDGANDSAVDVTYATADGTATGSADATCDALEDFIRKSGVLSFGIGQSSNTISVDTCSDLLYEGNEAFSLTLSTPITGPATVGTPATETMTITDDDGVPTVSVDDHTFTLTQSAIGEGFTITLSNPSATTIVVPYSTNDLTATGGATCTGSSDYVSANSSYSFMPGETSKLIDVQICTDNVVEPTETFEFNLGAPTGATILDGQGIGTITSEDTSSASIGDVTLSEGNVGPTTFSFGVTLTNPVATPVTINYTVTPGTATTPSDYSSSGTSIIIPANTTGPVNIDVAVNGDTTHENNEAFTVTISSGDVSIGTATGTGTINNDDAAPTISINDNIYSTQSAAPAGLTVSLSGNATDLPVTVNYQSNDVTATGGATCTGSADYEITSGMLTFNPGTTSLPINVNICPDSVQEPTETFEMNLSSPSGATFGDNQGIGTIQSDDSSSASIGNVAQVELNSSTSTFSFAVTLDNPVSTAVTINYTVTPGTATTPSDYTSSGTSIVIPANTTTGSIDVTVNGDTNYEADEAFTVTIASGDVLIGTGTGTGTITNDDNPPGTLVVTNTTDNDGVCLPLDCSLRQAINSANANADVNTITFNIPGAGPDVITIGATGVLAINQSVSIQGPTVKSTTVNGTAANPTRIFLITAGTVGISNLTVSGARFGSGGGVFVQGANVTLQNMLFSNNTIGSSGSGGGAGVSGGTLSVINSTFSNNSAVNGGALYNGSGTLNLLNVTVTNNDATGDLGGGPCQIASEGGGLDNFGGNPTSIRNSIIANNTACNPSFPNISGTFTDLGNNITSGDPLVGPLQNNGGPTFTRALQALSPAIDTGNDCVLTLNGCGSNPAITTDQRGVSRPRGVRVDIGAFEVDACVPQPANMVAWYSGENHFRDIQGPTFENGAASGGTVGFTTGKVGQAFNFTASGFANMGTPAPLVVTGNQITLDGWVRPTTVSDAVYFGRSASGANDYLLLNQFGGLLSGMIKTSTGETIVNAPSGPPVGQWSHIALTYDGAMMRLYMNGLQVGSTPKTGNITNSGQPFGIGGRTTGLKFNGAADEVEVFNRALSASEVANLYNSDIYGKCKSGLIEFTSPTYTIGEGGTNASITVRRTDGSVGAVSATFDTSNGTATTAGLDYTTTSTTVNFANGDSADKTVLVPINDDGIDEVDETVNVALTSATGGAFIGSQATGVLTITDNDTAAASIGDVTQAETTGGTTTFSFPVTLTLPVSTAVTVNYTVTPGTATTPSDYTSSGTSIIIPANTTTGSIDVTVNGDNEYEPNEAFTVTITSTQVAIGTGTGTGTITNDDLQPVLAFSSVNYNGNEGTSATITVNRTGAAGNAVSVNYATGGGTAMAGVCGSGGDYVATSGTLNLAANQMSNTFAVVLCTDAVTETPETVGLTLTSPGGGAALGVSAATLTIIDPAVGGAGFEGDVMGGASPGIGNGAFDSGDVTRVRRLVTGLSTPNLTVNEFQRADSAPYIPSGDGRLTSGDVTVARRFVAGDLSGVLKPAGGPISPVMFAPLFEEYDEIGKLIDNSLRQTEMRIVGGEARRGENVTVAVELDQRGTENAFSYTLHFDPTQLSMRNGGVAVSALSSVNGGLLTVNYDDLANGNIGILLDMPAGQVIVPGEARHTILLTFYVPKGAAAGETPITFTSDLVEQYLSDMNGDPLFARFTPGRVRIGVGSR